MQTDPWQAVTDNACIACYPKAFGRDDVMIGVVHFIHRIGRLLLLLATASAPLSALAQDSSPHEKSWHLSVALGDGRRTNPLAGGEATDINYVVDFAWYGDHFFFDNGDLGYTFTTVHNLSLGSLLTFSNERNDYSFLTGRQFGLDTPSNGAGLVAGNQPGTSPGKPDLTTSLAQTAQTPLAHRDTAINGGFELLYISPLGDIQAQLLSDVSNTHNGQTAWLSWSHPWYTTNSELSLTLGLEWKSRKLVGYYYGVRPEEALPDRNEYQGASGMNTYVRLAGRYHLNEHWTLAAMAEREFLSSAITDSPVVTSDAVDTFFAGLFYNF